MGDRFEKFGEVVCDECGFCKGKKGFLCDNARGKLRSYSGIRLTSDGFDCALPVTIDSHSMCSYACSYCFSEQLAGHVASKEKPIGQMSLKQLENIFSGKGGKMGGIIRKALKYDNRNSGGFPCPVQLGGINDPCDNIERQQGWLLEFMRLAIKYSQPVRISTKGTLLREKDYLKMLSKAPHLFWVAFSINTIDDERAARVDIRAPAPSDRLKTMKVLSEELGIKTSLRCRPIYPGLTDSTPKHPQAWKELLDRAKEAGAYAISYECGFVPMRFTKVQQKKWENMEKVLGVPLKRVYKELGKSQVCLRPSYLWVEQIMHAIKERAVENGLQVGVSDPCWKQLSQHGCCCGIPPDDEVFGNWERENATNAVVKARDAKKDKDRVIRLKDIIPEWAYDTLMSSMCNMGAGPKTVFAKRHFTWADKLKEIWNDPGAQRSPLHYFQGALQPEMLDEELVYRYIGLKRAYPSKTPFWKIGSGYGQGKGER